MPIKPLKLEVTLTISNEELLGVLYEICRHRHPNAFAKPCSKCIQMGARASRPARQRFSPQRSNTARSKKRG